MLKLANKLASILSKVPLLGPGLLDGWYWKGKGALILLYHDISPVQFEVHLNWLAPRFKILPLDELLKLIAGKADCHRYLSITFDNGWRRNIELLPVLRKFNIPITLYLIADYVYEEKEIWFRTIKNLQKLGVNTLPAGDYKLLSEEERTAEIKRLMSMASYSPQDTLLAIPQIKTLMASRLVTIGSHSRSHASLPSCDAVKAVEEIRQSKAMLEAIYGKEINGFSYPFGDFTSDHVELIKQAGYLSAVTSQAGVNNGQCDLFQLKRIMINPEANRYLLALMVNGFLYRLGVIK